MQGGTRHDQWGSQRASELSGRFATLCTVCASPSSPWGGKRQPTGPKLEQKPRSPTGTRCRQGRKEASTAPGRITRGAQGDEGAGAESLKTGTQRDPGVPTSKIRR